MRLCGTLGLETAEGVSDAVQNSVDEAGGAGAPEPVRQPDRFIDGHLRGNVPLPKLMDSEPKDIALDGSDPAHPPVVRRLRQLRVQRGYIRHDLGGQLLGPIENSRLR